MNKWKCLTEKEGPTIQIFLYLIIKYPYIRIMRVFHVIWSMQFMTEMKETAFIMQNISKRYMILTDYNKIDKLWHIWNFNSLKVFSWVQKSCCDGWVGESDFFIWWICNGLELLWASIGTESVISPPPLMKPQACSEFFCHISFNNGSPWAPAVAIALTLLDTTSLNCTQINKALFMIHCNHFPLGTIHDSLSYSCVNVQTA